MLVYAIGEKLDDISALLKLSANDSKNYDIVLQKFEDHFNVKNNKKYERSNFKKRENLQSICSA